MPALLLAGKLSPFNAQEGISLEDLVVDLLSLRPPRVLLDSQHPRRYLAGGFGG